MNQQKLESIISGYRINAADAAWLRSLGGPRDNKPSLMELWEFGHDPDAASASETERCHGLDTPERVRFYEHDFYPLSNFSAFRVQGWGRDFDTSEHAYHWHKFPDRPDIQDNIQGATSAHEAFKYAEKMKPYRRADWDAVKVDVMRDILRAKVSQHEYVRRKLLATGERELVEDSWRDTFWGWGPNLDGENMLGRLWMELRRELVRGGAVPLWSSERESFRAALDEGIGDRKRNAGSSREVMSHQQQPGTNEQSAFEKAARQMNEHGLGEHGWVKP